MTQTTRSAVAIRIADELRRQGLKQHDLATKTGMTQQAVSRRLKVYDAAPITVVEVEQFAHALNVSVAWLFGETETPARADSAADELVNA